MRGGDSAAGPAGAASRQQLLESATPTHLIQAPQVQRRIRNRCVHPQQQQQPSTRSKSQRESPAGGALLVKQHVLHTHASATSQRVLVTTPHLAHTQPSSQQRRWQRQLWAAMGHASSRRYLG